MFLPGTSERQADAFISYNLKAKQIPTKRVGLSLGLRRNLTHESSEASLSSGSRQILPIVQNGPLDHFEVISIKFSRVLLKLLWDERLNQIF